MVFLLLEGVAHWEQCPMRITLRLAVGFLAGFGGLALEKLPFGRGVGAAGPLT